MANAIADRLRTVFSGREETGKTKPTTSLTPMAVMLSGGSTPLAVFQKLVDNPVAAANNLWLFMSDERYVPGDAPDNNFFQASAMMKAIGLPSNQGLRVRTELPSAEEAADDFEDQLQQFLDRGGRIPLGLLGLGSDGHTASLFNETQLSQTRGRLAMALDRPDGRQGISATPELFLHIDIIIFLVAGSSKRDRVKALLSDPGSTIAGQAVRGCGRVELWTDQR